MAKKITPITQQRFEELAEEEGVPIEIAAGMYGMESSYGQNPRAFDFPDDPTRRGVGSLQLIKSTFESVYPGVAYEDATDEDFTRAGLRNIKKAELPDGTYDIDKLLRTHFGAGFDPSFYIDENGKRQAKDPNATVPVGGKRYKPSTDPTVRRDLEKYTDNFLWQRNIGNYTNPYKVVNSAPENPENPQNSQALVAAEEKPDDSSELARAREENAAVANKVMEQWEARQQIDQAAKNKALDQFGLNPYGNYGKAQELANALTKAQGNLQATIDAFNIAEPSGGIGGTIMDALKRFGARQIMPEQVAQFKVLSDSAKQMNDIAKQFVDQASSMGTAGQFLAAHQESRLTADSAGRLEQRIFNAQKAENSARMAEANLAIRQSQEARQREAQEYKNELAQARTEAAKATAKLTEARISGKLGLSSNVKYTPEFLEQMNQAAEQVFQTMFPGEANLFRPAKTFQEFEAAYLKGTTPQEKEVASRIRLALGTGTATGPNADIRDSLLTAAAGTSDPVVQANMYGISTKLDKLVKAEESSHVERAGGKKGVSFDTYTLTKSPKEIEQIRKSLYTRARAKLLMEPGLASSFKSNPLNMHSLPQFIALDKTSGINELLAANNIPPTELRSDDELLSRLASNLATKNSPNSKPEILDTLQAFYRQLATTRASQKELKQFGLNIPADSYTVQSNKEVYDLTNKRDLDMYFTKILKGIQSAQATRSVPSAGGRFWGGIN